MKRYRTQAPTKGLIQTRNTKVGETIETKVQRLITNKEPIGDGAPPIYTDRKDGVLAGTNIRTRTWELAAAAADKITAQNLADRKKQGITKEDIVKDGNEESSSSEQQEIGD